jgi:RHS repeat-associated protein
MSYVYDMAGNVTSETYPSGRVIATSFDAAGRIASVSGQKAGEPNRTYASGMSYAPHGALAQCTYGNNLIEQTSFNSRLQPTSITVSSNPFPYLPLSIGLNYDTTNNNGNVLSQTISNGGTQTYTYDEVNRLKTAEEGSGQNYWKQEFDYDRFGNRRFNTTNTTSNVLGPNPQIDEATNRFLASEGYLYDEAGNLRQEPGKSYKYDAESRLTEFNSGSALYFYDGDGRRVKKAVGTDVTVFVYNIAGQLVAEYRNTPVELGGGTSFVTTDHLGSIRFITHRNGDIKSRHDYLPFGEEVPQTVGGRSGVTGYGASDSTRHRFTNKERDGESGLDYFLARYYSSAQGRFTSADPLFLELRRLRDPQQLNLYAYTRGNPLKFIDPLGLDITLTGSVQEEYIKQLQKKVSFTVQTNTKTNKVEIVGKDGKALSQKELADLGKTLKGTDLAVFNAITDTNNHVTIDTGNGKDDPAVFFGQEKGATHKIDFADLAKLDKAGGPINASDAVLHETLEAYAQAQGKSFVDAHNSTLEFGPALGVPRRSRIQNLTDTQGNVTGQIIPWSVDGKPANGRPTFLGFITVQVQFVTPIPKGAVTPTDKALIVDVKK